MKETERVLLPRADAALIVAECLGLTPGADRAALYGLFPDPFPGEYDGHLDQARPDLPTTREVAVVVMVRWAGWNTVRYDHTREAEVLPFVTPEGFPLYEPDPTPRAVPYVIVALTKGLLQPADLEGLREEIDERELRRLCQMTREIKTDSAVSEAPARILRAPLKEGDSNVPERPEQIIVVPPGWSNYSWLRDLPNPILNLGSSIRLTDAQSPLCSDKQDYFPLGPLDTLFTLGKSVAANSYAHQSQALYARIDNASTTVNAVGLWGAAQSLNKDARIWAGFLQCSTATGDDLDCQAIGLEIDVLNFSLPGGTPNRSKTGLQIVGIGTAACTNAIEILGSGEAQWYNGILVAENTICEDGSVLGVAQRTPIARGIDLSHCAFTDAAVKISNGSEIKFRSKLGRDAAIYADAIDEGLLVVRAGRSGFRITDNEDSRNLLWITPDGSLEPSCELAKSLERMIEARTKPKRRIGAAVIAGLLVAVGLLLLERRDDPWRSVALGHNMAPPVAARSAS